MSRTRRRIGAEYRTFYKPPRFPDAGSGNWWLSAAFFPYHTDNFSHGETPPREFVRLYKRKMNRHNDRMLRRWLHDPEFDPVFDVKTYHRAQWAWN